MYLEVLIKIVFLKSQKHRKKVYLEKSMTIDDERGSERAEREESGEKGGSGFDREIGGQGWETKMHRREKWGEGFWIFLFTNICQHKFCINNKTNYLYKI